MQVAYFQPMGVKTKISDLTYILHCFNLPYVPCAPNGKTC